MIVQDNKNLVRKLPSHRNLMMGVSLRKNYSNEEEKKNVRVLGLPYLKIHASKGQQDGK